MRKWLIRLAPLVGAAIIVQSVFWELARMDPAYRRIVFPWSIRGTDTVHGAIIVAIGIGLAIIALLVGWERSEKRVERTGIVIATIVIVVAIPLMFADGNDTVALGTAAAAASGAFIGLMVTLALRDLLVESYPAVDSLLGFSLLTIVMATVFAFLTLALTDGGAREYGPAVLVGIIFVVLGVYSLLRSPRELAANRMFMFVAVAALAVLTLQAGAIRQTLLRTQRAFTGSAFGWDLANLSGEYKDSQVTSGWFLATFGAFFVLIAAIAMWARRRDYILSLHRARKQREAAEKSAGEIKEAIELAKAQRARAKAAASTGSPDAGIPPEPLLPLEADVHPDPDIPGEEVL